MTCFFFNVYYIIHFIRFILRVIVGNSYTTIRANWNAKKFQQSLCSDGGSGSNTNARRTRRRGARIAALVLGVHLAHASISRENDVSDTIMVAQFGRSNILSYYVFGREFYTRQGTFFNTKQWTRKKKGIGRCCRSIYRYVDRAIGNDSYRVIYIDCAYMYWLWITLELDRNNITRTPHIMLIIIINMCEYKWHTAIIRPTWYQ